DAGPEARARAHHRPGARRAPAAGTRAGGAPGPGQGPGPEQGPDPDPVPDQGARAGGAGPGRTEARPGGPSARSPGTSGPGAPAPRAAPPTNPPLSPPDEGGRPQAWGPQPLRVPEPEIPSLPPPVLIESMAPAPDRGLKPVDARRPAPAERAPSTVSTAPPAAP